MKKEFLSLLLILVVSGCTAQTIDINNLKKHITTLASDSLQGRGTGTEGEKMAASYIEKQFLKMGLSPKGDNGSYLQAFTFKAGAHGTGAEGTANNVVAYLDNGQEMSVVIGAHYDHLGTGTQGSSLDANPQGKIHNGADDNASGIAGVLELARYFNSNPRLENYNFIFVCFSGEELGLYGSKFFTEHLPVNASKINYMVNMDMIGRLNPESKSLAISGTGTSPVWEPLLKSLSNEELKIKTDSSGIGPSDHSSFNLKNIPALHFFTGSHSDYHKPSDDADKINYEGEAEVLKLIVKVIEKLDSQPKLAFLTTKNKSLSSSRSFKVTLGIMPSYTSEVEGLLVDGVTDGKPAQKAGILTGDVITQIGDHPIKDIQQYMEILGKYEKGQSAPVKVKRKAEELTFIVTF